jgi:hypothetical protein
MTENRFFRLFTTPSSLIYFSVWFLNICQDSDGIDDTRNHKPEKRIKFLKTRKICRGVAEILGATVYAEIDGRKHQTEHGAIMLAAVLNTPRAIEISVFVVRAFVRLREILSNHKALANRLAELESKIETHDEAIRSLVSAIRQLMPPPAAGQKKIGLQLREKRASYGKR